MEIACGVLASGVDCGGCGTPCAVVAFGVVDCDTAVLAPMRGDCGGAAATEERDNTEGGREEPGATVLTGETGEELVISIDNVVKI